jgi:Tol biopolymer transport system component/predicted Ser/Thr protein kinase
MGVVYKCRDTILGRFVALKVLTPDALGNQDRRRRLINEARTASALNHPNIVTIYEVAEADGVDFIAMEYVEGSALNAVLQGGPLSIERAVRYASDVAGALAAAHQAGVVHRDIKPGNILITRDDRAKVLDFGLAKSTETSSGSSADAETRSAGVTEPGMVVGTVAYMSPEQAQGKKVDSRTDIFSFGALLYEMITGRRAFGGDSAVSILSAILRDEPAPAPEITRGIPRELDRIVTRCLQKDRDRRYQHAGDLKIDLEQVKEGLAASGPVIGEEMPRRPSMGRWWWLAAAAACVAVSFAVVWWLRGPQAALPPWNLTRLTADSGLSGTSALSPDGKLVAYSSDRSLDGERDLYVKQVTGGQPIRLTSDGAGNTTPDFSPDGSKIVFRSNRDGGGIYEIPAFGGEVRLVVREGLNPKFSPDGSQVAYWVGPESVAAAIPGGGVVRVVPEAGGLPRRVGSNFTAARYPIWSPDGKHVLMIGYTSAKSYESSSIDWWLVAPDGGEAVKTGAYEALVHAGLQPQDPGSNPGSFTPIPSVPRPGCWLADNTVIFSNVSGDAQNLWEIGVSPRTGKVSGALKRLTTGTGKEVEPSCASGGALTFTSVETRRDIWSLPFDLDRGTSKGALERITRGPAVRETPSLSNNGHYVAFASDQSGRRNVWLRELATGKESMVASSPLVQRYPVSDASGARIAFSVYEKDKLVVYVSAPGGAPEKLCEACQAGDWSRDGKTLLVSGGKQSILDLASHQQVPLLKHPTYSISHGRFSPDNRWVSFTARIETNRGRIVIAPVDGPKPVPESAWVTIAEAGSDDYAIWSPDGKTLYFTSPRDGYSCLWGQRIEATSRRPVGNPFAVQHLHGRLSYRHTTGWSAAGGRIALALAEASGNIWTMSRPGAR